MDETSRAPEKPPKQKRGRVRRWSLRFLKGILALVALVVLTVLAAWIGLQTKGGRAFLLDKLAPVLSTAIPGKIEVGSIDEARLGLITLRNVVIRDPEGNEVIRVGEAHVRPDFGALLKGTIDLTSVVAKDVKVVLRTTERGTLSIVDTFVSDEPSADDGSSPIQVFVRAARIDRGRVILDVMGDPPVELRNVAIRGSVAVTDATRITVRSLGFEGSRGGRPLLGARSFSGAYRSAPGEWSRIQADLRGGEDVIRILANARNPATETAPIEETTLHAQVSLAPLTSRLLDAFDQGTLRETVPSRIRAEITLSGSMADARLRGDFNIGDESITLTASYVAESTSRVRVCTAKATLPSWYAALPQMAIGGCFQATAGAYSTESFPVTFEMRGAAVDETDLPDLRARGRVSIERSEAHIDAIELPNVPESTPPRVAVSGRVGFDGSLEVSLATNDLRPKDDPALAKLLAGIRCVLDAQVEVRLGAAASEDAPNPLQARADLTVRELSASGTRIKHLHAVAGVNGTTAAPRFDVRADLTQLASGGFSAKTASLHAAGTESRAAVDLRAELARQRGIVAHADARAVGSVWHADLRASAGTPEDTWHMVVERAAYDLERENARVDLLRIAHGDSEIEASGRLSGSGAVEANVRIDKLLVHDLLRALGTPIPGLESTLAGTVSLGGTTSVPTARAELTLEDTKAQGVDGINAQLTLDYGRTSANLGATVEAEDLAELSLAGTASWGSPMPAARVMDVAALDVTLDIERLSLALLEKVAPTVVGFAGDVSGEVRVTGQPSSPVIAVDLTAESLVVPGVPVAIPDLTAGLDVRWEDALEARLTAEDETGDLLTSNVRLELPSSALVDGAIVLSETEFRMDAQLAERPFDSLPIDATPLHDQGFTANARVEVVHVPGRPLAANVTARLHGDPSEERSLPASCEAVGEVEILLDGGLDANRTELTARLKTGANEPVQIIARAETPVDQWLAGTTAPAIDIDVEGRIAALDLGAVPVACTHVRGTLEGTLAITSLGTPRAEAQVHLASSALRFAADAPVSLQADVRAKEGELEANVALRASTGGHGEVRAKLPFTLGEDGTSPGLPNGPIDARAVLEDFSLEPIAGITPFIRRRAGKVDGHLTVQGTLEAPEPNGELAIHEATLMMPGLEQRLSDLEARVSLSPTRLVVHEFSARDVRGRLSLTAEAAFEGQVPMRLEAELDAERFPVRQAGVVIAEVTSRAKLELVREEGALRGELEFQRLDVHMPDELRTSIQDLEENPDIVYVDSYPPGWEPPEVIEPEEAQATSEVDDESPFVPTFFHIDMSRPFWIRRSDFAIELDAELDIGVVEEGLRLSGTVNTRRGFIELLGSSFDIEEGTVRFPGGTRIDPVLDLTAKANPGLANEVTVRIKGTIAGLELKFYDKSQRELTAGLAVQCITTSQCGELGEFSSGNEDQAAEQQAQSALASLTVGLLTAAARHGLGDAVPRIGISSGGGFDEVTARVGFEANRLIPKFLRSAVLSLYIEGFISSDQNDETSQTAGVQESNAAVSGGFLVELRHPRRLVTRGRFAPRSGWSLDITWQR